MSAPNTLDDVRTPPSRGSRAAAGLDARNVSAWFGSNKVLDRVSLTMHPRTVTALIGPSGCGKSTFLRILNRLHESIASAKLAGEVLLNGEDIYAPGHRITETRKRIGMVFQKPNPFPAMSIADNVTAGLKLTGTKVSRAEKTELIERCLTRGGLWDEVKDRLNQRRVRHCPEASSSGSASPARWPSTPTSSSWTSPARRSIPLPRVASRRRLPTWRLR